MNVFRKNWYENALNPRHPEANEMLSKFEIPKFSHSDADIKEMCMEYFKGMQWILRYYMFGPTAITSRYVYVYLYARFFY